MYIYIYVCIYIYIFMYMCIYVYIYVYICIYTVSIGHFPAGHVWHRRVSNSWVFTIQFHAISGCRCRLIRSDLSSGIAPTPTTSRRCMHRCRCRCSRNSSQQTILQRRNMAREQLGAQSSKDIGFNPPWNTPPKKAIKQGVSPIFRQLRIILLVSFALFHYVYIYIYVYVSHDIPLCVLGYK